MLLVSLKEYLRSSVCFGGYYSLYSVNCQCVWATFYDMRVSRRPVDSGRDNKHKQRLQLCYSNLGNHKRRKAVWKERTLTIYTCTMYIYTTCRMQVICLYSVSSEHVVTKTKTNITLELMQMMAIFVIYLFFLSGGNKTHYIVLYIWMDVWVVVTGYVCSSSP